MWWGLCELKGVRALLVLTLPLIWMDGWMCVCSHWRKDKFVNLFFSGIML